MKVIIYSPTKTAMQSGKKNTGFWVINSSKIYNSRSIDQFTGWTSSSDTKNQIRLNFKTKDEAIEYAKSQGFDYEVFDPKISTIKKKSYADNFR